jgi:hypothetical protein
VVAGFALSISGRISDVHRGRVKDLEQLRAQQPFGRDRGTTDPRVHAVELTGHVAQHPVDQRADRAERVSLRHALLGRYVTEHRVGLAIVSSHARDGST